MTSAPVELEYEIATRPGAADRLLLLVHGYGEPASSLLDRLDLLDPEGCYTAVAPTAPFVKDGRPVWHRAMTGDYELAASQLLLSLEALDGLLDVVSERTGLARADAVVGGFSQGGGLAYGLLLSAAVAMPPAGAFGICSFPPAIPGFAVDLDRARGRPLFLCAARRDRFADIDMSRDNAAVLAELGLAVSYHETDTEHVITDEACRLAGRWLTDVHAGRAPTTAPPPHAPRSDSYLRLYRS